MSNNYCSKCHKIGDFDIMYNITDDFYVCPKCFDKIKNSNPREYTQDEISEKLVKHFWGLLEYWEELPDKNTTERMSGMLHSILATLDGSSGDMPGFKIIPITDPTDKPHRIAFGENWYPETDLDVGGDLHMRLYKHKPTLKRNRLRKLRKISRINENRSN